MQRSKTTSSNPFEWLLRATSHDLNGVDVLDTLVEVGRMWMEEEQPFVCAAKEPFYDQSRVWCGTATIIPPCADHTRYVKDDRSTKLCMCVIEPYQQSMEAIEQLIRFCKAHDLTFTVDGESSHFPGGCFRVVIKKINADRGEPTAVAHLASAIDSFIGVEEFFQDVNDPPCAVALDTVLHYRTLVSPPSVREPSVREPSVQNHPCSVVEAGYLVDNLDAVIVELQAAREMVLQVYGDARELGQGTTMVEPRKPPLETQYAPADHPPDTEPQQERS